jgi:phage shock protein A
MGILGRMSALIKSNVNDLLSRMTDPGKEVDLLIDEMEEAARKARQEVKTCLAEEKRLEKVADRQRAEANDWERRAAQAVEQGDDALAKQALLRKAESEERAAETDKALLDQKGYVDQLTASLKALDQRVAEVKSRRGTLKQQARAAKGASQSGDPTSPRTGAFAEFERMSSRIDQLEAEAEVEREMAAQDGKDPDAERKLRELDHKSSVDDALAELKKKLNR